MSFTPADENLQPAVVLVHGIWMTGLEMGLLARRLEASGFVCYRLPYSSLRHSPGYNADALADFVADLAPRHPVVHLVGHSLGGRIIELSLSRHRLSAPGRVLTLGTPFGGSHVARVLSRHPWSKLLLGASAPLLLTSVPRWQHQRPLGVIAGDYALGIGLFFPGMPKPNDGTVALEETVINGAAARFKVHTAHLPMLFDREVATLTAAFLQSGAFITRPVKNEARVVAKPAATGTATPCRNSSTQR